jgi:hypothetical protein
MIFQNKLLSRFINSFVWLLKPKLKLLLMVFMVLLTTKSLAFPQFYEDEEITPAIEHKQDLSVYVDQFCRSRGRSFVRVQNNIVIDCLTSDSLWKVDYADNWPNALVQAMAYSIYDDYRGDEKYAPNPAIVLVQEDADDYKNMVQLKQLVTHYKLPIKLDVIENYASPSNASSTISSPASRVIKNFQIDFFGNKKNLLEVK